MSRASVAKVPFAEWNHRTSEAGLIVTPIPHVLSIFYSAYSVKENTQTSQASLKLVSLQLSFCVGYERMGTSRWERKFITLKHTELWRTLGLSILQSGRKWLMFRENVLHQIFNGNGNPTTTTEMEIRVPPKFQWVSTSLFPKIIISNSKHCDKLNSHI